MSPDWKESDVYHGKQVFSYFQGLHIRPYAALSNLHFHLLDNMNNLWGSTAMLFQHQHTLYAFDVIHHCH